MQTAAILVAGLVDIGFAIFHAMFWRIFDWPARLEASGAFSAFVTQTLNAILIYVFTIYGATLIGYGLAGHPAPSLLVLGGGAFWGLRFLLQPIFFRSWSRPMAIITVAFFVAAIAHGLAAFGGANISDHHF